MAQKYLFVILTRMKRLKHKNRLLYCHLSDIIRLINAGNGKKIDIGIFENMHNLGNAMAVSICLDHSRISLRACSAI